MRFRRSACACAIAVAAAAIPASTAARLLAAQQNQGSPAFERIELTAGRSTVLTTAFDVTRIAITNPAVADATVVEPREVLIDGKAPGTISLILWGGDTRVQYDVVVAQPVTNLEQQLRQLFPGEDINVTTNDEATTLSGHVSSTAIMLKAGEIAGKTSAKTKLINLLEVPGGIESQQVMLQVRFAEVNRQALYQLGVGLFTSPTGVGNTIGRVATQQFAVPNYTNLQSTKQSSDVGAPVAGASGEFTFSDFLNLFLYSERYDIGGVLKALQSRGQLQSLAEPNLIAYNGQEASFLAGGEVPVPVVQSSTGVAAVTVVYKEFGIRLTFTPTIAGDTIRLHVKPEVSSLDFANGVSLGGFTIPALQTRRAETDVELRDGQSFAIAGLLNNVSQDQRQRIPLMASLPIIGNLFKSKSESQQRTELMVLITPHLVRPLDPDEVPALPTDPSLFLPSGPGAGDQMQGGGGTVDGPGLTPGAAPGSPPDNKK